MNEDYLTLRSVDTNLKGSDGIISWYIPDSFYTNDRGAVCDFQICLFDISGPGGILPGPEYFSVECDLPVYNSDDTTNDNFNLCGIISNDITTQFVGQLPSYRTTARPRKISILIRRPGDERLDWTVAGVDGLFVFRFRYYDPERETKEYNDTFYKTL